MPVYCTPAGSATVPCLQEDKKKERGNQEKRRNFTTEVNNVVAVFQARKQTQVGGARHPFLIFFCTAPSPAPSDRSWLARKSKHDAPAPGPGCQVQAWARGQAEPGSERGGDGTQPPPPGRPLVAGRGRMGCSAHSLGQVRPPHVSKPSQRWALLRQPNFQRIEGSCLACRSANRPRVFVLGRDSDILITRSLIQALALVFFLCTPRFWGHREPRLPSSHVSKSGLSRSRLGLPEEGRTASRHWITEPPTARGCGVVAQHAIGTGLLCHAVCVSLSELGMAGVRHARHCGWW